MSQNQNSSFQEIVKYVEKHRLKQSNCKQEGSQPIVKDEKNNQVQPQHSIQDYKNITTLISPNSEDPLNILQTNRQQVYKACQKQVDQQLCLRAEIEDSEEQQIDNQGGSSSSEQDPYSLRRMEGKLKQKSKINKEKKINIVGKKGKKIQKRANKEGLGEENIIEGRTRIRKNNISYVDFETRVTGHSHSKKKPIYYQQLCKQTVKNAQIEKILIKQILSSGMQGQYKYFLVLMANNEKVYISENNMKYYFPRALDMFYRVLIERFTLPQWAI